MYLLIQCVGEYETSTQELAIAESKLPLKILKSKLKKRDKLLNMAREEVDAIVASNPFTKPEPPSQYNLPYSSRDTKEYREIEKVYTEWFCEKGDWEFNEREKAIKIIGKKYGIKPIDIPYCYDYTSYSIVKFKKQDNIWTRVPGKLLQGV